MSIKDLLDDQVPSSMLTRKMTDPNTGEIILSITINLEQIAHIYKDTALKNAQSNSDKTSIQSTETGAEDIWYDLMAYSVGKCLPEAMRKFLDDLLRIGMLRVAIHAKVEEDGESLNLIENAIEDPDIKRHVNALTGDKTVNRKQLGLPKQRNGRPEHTGWFSSEDAFRVALIEVLKSFPKKPTQLEILKRLDAHSLCRRKPGKVRDQTHTVLLRGWLNKAKIKYSEETPDKALERIWSQSRTEK